MDFRDDLQRKNVLPMTMGALLWVLLPLFRLVPVWVMAFSLTSLLLAWWVKKTLPGVLRLFLVLGASAAVVMQHHALFSREAGLSLIVLMISFKLLETRQYRDVMLILAMTFFLMFTGFLLSPDLATSVYLLACLPLLLAALLNINRFDSASSAGSVFVGGGKLLALAMPMMIAFYFLFPRLAIPLWILPGSSSSSSSGFTEELNFGDVSSLALNDELAFRAEFDGAIPPEDQRYWRAVMLTEFNGYVWRLADYAFQQETLVASVERYRYTVTLQPHRGRWLPILDVPTQAPENYALVGGNTVWLGYELRRVLRYQGESAKPVILGAQLSERDRAQYMQLPSSGNPRARELGQQLRAQFAGHEAIAKVLFQKINEQDYFYTLSPPELAEDLIDDFWFNKRRGFCEHYAAATAFILRAAGVPTRVIGGYQGGELNPFGRYLSVSQADAHAWVEYWHEQSGWVRFDPTAAISPLRIEPDLRQRLRHRDGVFELAQWSSVLGEGQSFNVLQSLHDGWQLANQWFDSHVVQYNQSLQRDWLRQLGMKEVDKTTLLRTLFLALVVALSFSAWLLLRPQRARSALLRCYQQFERRMEKKGLVREVGEPPQHFFARCQQQSPQAQPAIQLFADRYLSMRFGCRDVDLKQLRLLLQKIP